MTGSLTAYHPWLRDRLSQSLGGNTRAHPVWGRVVQALTGSSGLSGGGNMGALDATPAAIALDGYDAGRFLANGQPVNALMSGASALPGASALMTKAAQPFIHPAVRATLGKALGLTDDAITALLNNYTQSPSDPNVATRR